jgi:formylglycine-generating enzyme required for sulfatase activity
MRISIGFLILLVGLAVSAHAATGPTVSNVSASQETGGQKRLVITYDLLDADSSIVDVTFALSADGGSNYDIFPSAGTCTGDIGQVAPGAGKAIYWDVMSDYPEESGTNYKVRITADDLGFFVDLGGGVTMEFVYIPAGSFSMGAVDPWGPYPSEQPVHTVTFAEPFYMAATELTEVQWEAVMGGSGSWPGTDPNLGDNYPARYISWNDIRGTGGLIDQMNALGQGTFSLPTEAQWEYACRAGTTTRFSFGDSTCASSGCTSCDLDSYAWWCGNDTGNPHEVGGKTANPWGLFDMHGNVWEWCEDDDHSNYTGAPSDGSAWIESPRALRRMIRGGGWTDYDYAIHCRSASRFGTAPPGGRNYIIGFRLAAVR